MHPLLKKFLYFNFQSSRVLNKSFFSKKELLSARTKHSIRPLKITEFQELLKHWAVKEGWNPGMHEYLPFYMASLNAHKGLFLDNRLIASLSAVRYSKDLAFLGLYIVDPSYRAQGIGQILAESTLKELTGCSLLSLNAVQDQVGNYQRKYGFIPSYTNSRYSGYFKFKNDNSMSKTNIKILGRDNLDINQLIDYDASIFSTSREAFLRNWIDMPNSTLLAAIQDDKICGYGVISQCLQGYKLAPLFANDAILAKELYRSFASLVKEQTVIQLDAPDNNQLAIKLAEQFGLCRIFKTTRMYRGEEKLIKDLDDKNSRVYSIATLEIG